MENLNDSPSSAPAALETAAAATVTDPTPATPATPPATWEQRLAAIYEDLSVKIDSVPAKAILNDLAILAGRIQSLEASVREMVIPTQAAIEELVDRKIKAATPIAIASPAHWSTAAVAPVPAQPGADQPGPTHGAGDVGSTGSHGEIGANKA
jgi:hypothetical protein